MLQSTWQEKHLPTGKNPLIANQASVGLNISKRGVLWEEEANVKSLECLPPREVAE